MSRSTWVAAGLGLAVVALLMAWMGRTLDTKAPVRIDRGAAPPTPAPAPTVSPEEAAARELETMRTVVAERAPTLARRAAEQAFSGEEGARAQCTFTEATLVHRDGDSAYWNALFSCVDPRAAGSYPNVTSMSVRLARTGGRWSVQD